MTENKANAISVSLLNRKIYAVCYTGIDTLGAFHGALYNARRRFLETGKTARVREAGIYDGTPGEVRGKVSRRGFKWEKTAGGRTLEAAFSSGSQRGIAFRDPDGALRARIYFDREQHWVRTEYFAPDDDQRAKVSFKPDDTRDAVLRFDYSRSTGKTKETTLFPVPYAFQTAEQSLQNAHCGNDALLLIATDTGEFAYCPREEQQRRIRFMKDSRNASVMLSMGWEVKRRHRRARCGGRARPRIHFHEHRGNGAHRAPRRRKSARGASGGGPAGGGGHLRGGCGRNGRRAAHGGGRCRRSRAFR